MNKQVKMYCIKLNLVRTKEENSYSNMRRDIEGRKYNFRKGLSTYVKKQFNVEVWNNDCSILFKEIIKNSTRYMQIEKELKIIKKKIHEIYLKNKDIDRVVNSKDIRTKDVIAIGSNNLVRTMGLNLGSFTDKIITVKIGDMDNLITEKIIKDGLTIDNEKYQFFTAGAGQTRQKKFMMIKEDKDLNEIMLSLMCGLTIKDINKQGMNINKFLAYLALNNSGSEVWEGFDIDRCIVVDDFETFVSAKVDYIDRKVKEIKYIDKIGRERVKNVANWELKKGETMDIPIPHFDGLGIMLPCISKTNMQVRLNWLKGLLTPFNYIEYCQEKGYSTKIKDIYEKEYDVVKDNIQIIFTKSQFKLWKFYSSWDDYKEKFKKYNCTANICATDEVKENKYKDMEINYQMLQQLINMTDGQIEILTTDFKKLIKQVHTDRNSQLKFLGATNKNEKRNYFQEALRIYPEMLNSAFVKKKISETMTKAKKDVCSGKIKIKGSRRVYILSDPCAFVDWLFGNIKVPEGVLKDGEVYCNLFKKSDKLDVLRSPSLSFEHVIRNNVRTEGENKWFATNGIYTSTHDIISKILQFDVDGDEALVLDTDWIIKLAEEMIEKYDIRPQYYEMGKAGAMQINNSNIAKSLLFVYEKSNIGKVSNTLTKIWNTENPMGEYQLMQKLCAYNNDIIDSAKTLSIPKLPTDVKNVIKDSKYPYFFQYAKNKKEGKCLEKSNSVMDRICSSIESIGNTKFDYSKGFGTFRVKNLMFNQNNIEVNKEVIEKYKLLEASITSEIDAYVKEYKKDDDEDMKKTDFKEIFYSSARKEFEDWGKANNITLLDIIDSIIKYTFKQDDLKMAFLWNVFGQEIINNLNINLKKSLDKGHIMCNQCGTRVKKEANNHIRCTKCSKKQTHKKVKGDSKKAV